MTGLALLLLAAASAPAGPAAPPGPCLLVPVERAGDRFELGPAFHLEAARCPPASAGPLAVRALGPEGELLAEARLALAPVASASGPPAAGGTATLLLAPGRAERLAGLELREGDRTLAARRPEGTGGRARAGARRAPDGRVRVTWVGRAWPFALLRDPASGEVLGSARGGEALLATGGARVELLLSDGVRGRRLLLRVR